MKEKIIALLNNPIVKRWIKGFVATVGAAILSAAGSYVIHTLPNLFTELGWTNVLTLAGTVATLLGIEKAIPNNL